MRRKLPLIILITIMLVQLFIPAGLIMYQNSSEETTQTKGEIFIFEIHNIAYSNKKLTFNVKLPYGIADNRYLIAENNGGDFSTLTYTNEKPETEYYIKSDERGFFSFPVNHITTDEYKNLETAIFFKLTEPDEYTEADEGFVYFTEAYMYAYVYKGKISISKVFIDGIEAKEYLQQLNDNL